MQDCAKQTMNFAMNAVKAGMSLAGLRMLCENKLLSMGADSFWYWDVGAFIFSGDETSLSVSGREYSVSDKVIMPNDIITIDLSPQRNNYWGDYARTLIIENGTVIQDERHIKNQEWKNGIYTERLLHNTMVRFVNADTTFEELYFYINDQITSRNYINLDFAGNLGHTIESNKADRIYIEKGNTRKLSDFGMFTFEPHIGMPGSVFGYKMENIYYFDSNTLHIL